MKDERTTIVVDTETTSKYPETARVLEIGAVAVSNGLEVAAFSTLVRATEADLKLAEEALRVNGITRAELAAAPPFDLAHLAYGRFLAMFPGAKATAFNAKYDSEVLWSGGWPTSEWTECIMLAAMAVMGPAGALPSKYGGQGWKWPRLSEAAAFFEVKQEGAHRALDDARVAARVMLAIRRAERGGGGKGDGRNEAIALLSRMKDEVLRPPDYSAPANPVAPKCPKCGLVHLHIKSHCPECTPPLPAAPDVQMGG